MKLTRPTAFALALAAAISLPACADDTTGSDTQDATEFTITAEPRGGGELEVFRSQATSALFYYRVQAANGEIILRSEGYDSLGGVRNGAESLKRNGGRAAAYEFRQADNGEWYFVVKAGNGRIIGVSETYSRLSSAKRGANTLAGYVMGDMQADFWFDQCGFELYVDNADEFRFRLRSRHNGEKLLASEGYDSENAAKNAIDTVVTTSLISNDDGRLPAYQVFEGNDEQFYWRLKGANGQIVATGGEGFTTREAAESSIELVKEHANAESACWTVDELHTLQGGGDDGAVEGDVTLEGNIVAKAEEALTGIEVDPFVVGDVCILFVQPFDESLPKIGLVEDVFFCEQTSTYADCEGCELQFHADDLFPVSDAEREVLTDFDSSAIYFWLDGEITSPFDGN